MKTGSKMEWVKSRAAEGALRNRKLVQGGVVLTVLALAARCGGAGDGESSPLNAAENDVALGEGKADSAARATRTTPTASATATTASGCAGNTLPFGGGICRNFAWFSSTFAESGWALEKVLVLSSGAVLIETREISRKVKEARAVLIDGTKAATPRGANRAGYPVRLNQTQHVEGQSGGSIYLLTTKRERDVFGLLALTDWHSLTYSGPSSYTECSPSGCGGPIADGSSSGTSSGWGSVTCEDFGEFIGRFNELSCDLTIVGGVVVGALATSGGLLTAALGAGGAGVAATVCDDLGKLQQTYSREVCEIVSPGEEGGGGGGSGGTDEPPQREPFPGPLTDAVCGEGKMLGWCQGQEECKSSFECVGGEDGIDEECATITTCTTPIFICCLSDTP